jgi:hypothetical protein
MKTYAWIFFLFVVSFFSYTQQSETKYYTNEWLQKEVPQKKAKFAQIITRNADSTITTEVKDLKRNEIINSETWKGNEPFGIWKNKTKQGYTTVNYNFPLVYSTSEENCKKSTDIVIDDYFLDNDSLGYEAPLIKENGLSFGSYILSNITQSKYLMENEIQGRVFVRFSISKEGNIENLVVFKGSNIFLEKEICRLLREIKCEIPPKLNGIPLSTPCFLIPINLQTR